MRRNINRRKFVKSMVAGSLGVTAAAQAADFNILSAYPLKDKHKVAIMGVNGRGSDHATGYALQEKAEVAYICDVDSRAVAKGIELVTKAGQKNPPKGIVDFRRALDDQSVEVLSIAAPDHWHTPAAILGLQAGKNIYVEKPGSHNPAEGELLIKAASQYKKIVQLGNQRRSWPRVREAIQALHDGAIGNAYYARTWYTNNRPTIGKGNLAATPPWLDYDLWQGPAPRQPFKDNLVHYHWHWRWNWGTGEILNNGTHFIDLARWGLKANFPIKAYSTGGRFQYQDDWETPDTQVANFDFEGGKTLVWEGRSCNQRGINDMGSGVSFHGTQGTLEIRDNSYKIFNAKGELQKSVDSTTNTVITQTGPGFNFDKDHFANFLNCIEGEAPLNSPYEECFKSVLLCHLGNISYRTGRSLVCDPQNGHIKNDQEAMKLWSRSYEKGWEPKLT